jgi:hypothetical protein
MAGWPVSGLAQRSQRLLGGNAIVLGGGVLTYLALRDLARWQRTAIGAVCGCVITAVLVVAMLFEGWPASRLAPAPGRARTLGLTAALAITLNRSLAAYADTVPWAKATAGDWVMTSALSFIGAGIILHVGIGLRWPLTLKPKDDS